jgi:arabinan endo-1,5-alpha-L-arabinosidase
MKHLLSLFIMVICAFQPSIMRGSVTYIHDPFIIKEGEFYYLFATGQGIPIQRSTNLVNWDYAGQVFQRIPDWTTKEVSGFTGRIWAPSVSFVNGKYFLYYSISLFGQNRSCIGLAVNDTLDQKNPAYKWTDLGKVIESFPDKDNWNAIDPNLANDDKGHYYLSFGSFWDGIKMIEIDPLTGKPAKSSKGLISLAKRPGITAIEAPFIFHRNGYYYLFVSFDFCCRGVGSTYHIFVGRSEKVKGPYVDKNGRDMREGGGTLVLDGYGDYHGPGHNMVLKDGGTDFLVYHAYYAKRGGVSVLQICPIIWPDDGWPLAGEPHD